MFLYTNTLKNYLESTTDLLQIHIKYLFSNVITMQKIILK